MSYDINDSPQNLEEYQILIDYYYNQDQERYSAEVAKAKADAEKQWEAGYEKKREELIAQMEANLAAMTVDAPDGPQPLPEAKWYAKWNEGMKEINAHLAEEHKQTIEQAASFVQPAKTMAEVESTYSFFKGDILAKMEAEANPEPVQVDLYDALIPVGDSYWNVAEACYVNSNARTPIDQSRVLEIAPDATEENLRSWIKFYSQQDPRIKMGPEIMDTEELFTRLREERSKLLTEYDQKIAQLDRLIREHPDYATYSIQRAEWDAYATALCNLPSQEGAPWDGGGPETPWPTKPE